MARILINVPKTARRGEVIEIKTLISHHMETGFRFKSGGERIPRDIVTNVVARYNGEEVFQAEFFAAIAANPFLTFHTVASSMVKRLPVAEMRTPA